MEKLLSYGLVGCGHIAKRHAEIIRKTGRLLAVCDINEELATNFAVTYNCCRYNNFRTLIDREKDMNVVVLCTPNYLHAEQAIEALEAGYHVLCEKPMALHVSDAYRMLETARQCNKALLIVKQNRFNAPVCYLKELLDKQILGRIYSMSMNCLWNRNQNYYSGSSWKGKSTLDGGILFTQFSHFFDVSSWLLGKAQCLYAFGNNFAHKNITEFDDTIIASLHFDSGILGSLHFSTNAYKQNMEGSITILAENGSITIGGAYLNKITYHQVKDTDWPAINTVESPNNYGSYQGSMSNHPLVYDYFRDALAQDNLLYKDLETSISTVEMINSVCNKLKSY